MIVLLNGPLGIGKSTVAEALVERMEGSVMLDGDMLIATNPAPANELEYLHATATLLIEHHRRYGYRHFVINHIWRSSVELADLRQRFGDDEDCRCFLLSLPVDEHLRRIERRARARALDEREFELRTYLEEREALERYCGDELGVPFDVDARPEELVARILRRLDGQGWRGHKRC